MRRYATILIETLGLLALVGGPVAAQVDVTVCGQVVPGGQVGTLVADLDCSAAPGDGVRLQAGAALDLGGFRLIGNPGLSFDTSRGVICEGPCRVLGPGSIESFAGDGILTHGPVRVIGASIRSNGFRGIETDGAVKVVLADAVLDGNEGEAIYTGGGVTVIASTLANNGAGLSGLAATVADSVFFNNGVGINAVGRAKVRGSTFLNNGIGLQAARSLVRDCTMTDNNNAINGTGRTIVVATTITGSRLDGISAVSLHVKDSTVTGSGTACTTPGFPCADIDTREPPLLVGSVCDTSLAWQTHLPWGVCQAD